MAEGVGRARRLPARSTTGARHKSRVVRAWRRGTRRVLSSVCTTTTSHCSLAEDVAIPDADFRFTYVSCPEWDRLPRTVVVRMMRTALVCFASLCTFFCSAVRAGPIEQLVDVAFAPGTGSSPAIVARYENGGGGLLYGPGVAASAEADRRWQLQCGNAHLLPDAASRGSLVILANGTLLVASSRGVVAGALDGCASKLESPADRGEVFDLVADPTDPNAAIALVITQGMPTSSTSLWRRSAEGAWSALGTQDAVVATSVRAAAYNGRLRLYEAAVVAVLDEDAGTHYYTYELRYSDDGAMSFRKFALRTAGTPRVVGVDPANPDRIAVLIDEASGADSILVSHDRGATLTPYLKLGELGGLAFAPDGRVWIGGKASLSDSEQGVWAAADLASAPVRLPMADYAVRCLGYHAPSEKLYACQTVGLGVVDLGSGAFASVVALAAVSDLVRCDGANTAELCEPQLCSAYCGPGHFAAAPACAAYDKPECGMPVALQEATVATPGTSAERDAGARTLPPSAGTVAAGATAAGSGSADAGAALDASEKGACSILRVRGSDVTTSWWVACVMWAVVCSVATQRLRRRVRRGRRRSSSAGTRVSDAA